MLSKSCENSIVCWKPGTLDQSEREKEQRTTIIHKLDVSVVIMVMFRLVQVLKETVGTDGTLTKDWSIFVCKIVSLFLSQIRDCEIWFVRFSTDLEEKTLALGNTKGKIYTWDLTVLCMIRSSIIFILLGF